ncbi:viroplasmin family protein [Exiguobacterium chiriqhucha]|uniref:ribonuclease H1 domain-containing protein n=1 Tax=Exiguobacterium chiriqhucha TaxID=1385984 RepID=UPI00073676BD|nr:ribonuclease H family protein [Exiguobacterium chiriqhucha]
MKKVYAVRKGRRTGLFTTWAECETQVKGYTGAEYKSFLDNKSALEYLNKEKEIIQDSDDYLKVYVDGSYSKRLNTAGYGCIFVNGDKVIHKISQRVSIDPEENLWNVSAEIEGVLAGVKWAIEKKYKDVSVYYDYEGLERWFDGSWKANKKTTKFYIEQMKLYDQKIKIRFFKVKAHSGDCFNEMVDILAKSSLEVNSRKKCNLYKKATSVFLSQNSKK